MENTNASNLIKFLWAVMFTGAISGLVMILWAFWETSTCQASGTCPGAGIFEGWVIMFFSLPLIWISTIVGLVNYSSLKKQSLPISKKHIYLIRVGFVFGIPLLLLLQFQTYLALLLSVIILFFLIRKF